ncbi:RICIN domain-containing protein [Micromonospora sp. WMMD1155]|uniref:RICIN domain-containing protein n=2 Tax=Micromonospora sp. WMMD1155 TaxID=3016094 RepID=UPI00249CD374|nr:RICIN domain-containing protein [Micromonospora sp. WMMD1155]WFE48807.1 RICIN domain-containing protein [Micromonospora sp. WMMD1155]
MELAAFAVAVVLLIGVAVEVPPAIAAAGQLPGKPVPAGQLPTVVAAATSCPTLTAPRVAGQLMALTGFSTSVTGPAIAGMDDTRWSRWKPRANAQRDDTRDNILALAHETCEMVGQLRQAGFKGDLWGPAIAAQRGGIKAVIDAKGVPAAQKKFVDDATGYASWYADQRQFDPNAPKAVPSPTRPSPKPVSIPARTSLLPAALVPVINRAGGVCPQVTPVRIAAQLRAASNFDGNLRTEQGQGIAQFSPEMWTQYAGPSDSVWNPTDAITVLGSAMCDLTNQFSGFTGADPYRLSLGAFQWGANTIRQAGGLPPTSVAQLADLVPAYEPMYREVLQLNGNQVKPPVAASSPSLAPSSPPASGPAGSAVPSPPPSGQPAPPPSGAPAAPKQLYDPARTYQLQNAWAGAIVEIPGTDVAATKSGTRVQLWANTHGKDQYWRIAPAPVSGYVTITNNFLHKSLAVEKGSLSNQAYLVVADKKPDNPNHQWKLSDAGNGKVWITNRHSGKVLDLSGDDKKPPMAGSTWNGYLVWQWDLDKTDEDQKWLLLAS